MPDKQCQKNQWHEIAHSAAGIHKNNRDQAYTLDGFFDSVKNEDATLLFFLDGESGLA
jgi:hypothetical protein